MRNWKMIGIVCAVVLTAAATTAAYAPAPNTVSTRPSPTLTVVHGSMQGSYMAAREDVLHTRVAQSCIAHGQACVLNGTPCCNSSDSCKGTFPNTYCQ